MPLLIAVPVSFVACGGGDDHSPPSAVGGASGDGASGHGTAGTSGNAPGRGGATDDGGAAGSDAGNAGDGGTANPGGGSGGSGGSVANQPPSCKGGGSTAKCGPNEESCCLSPQIPGQTFFRSYDAVSADYKSQANPASVTSFHLDKFEVTVGRFRAFVSAVVGDAWRPSAGSGKHTHLNDGKGLANVGASAGNEPGWDPAWSAKLADNAADWDARLVCDNASSSWTSEVGSKELLPISCLDWYEAYAFCIWDEGFLPSEAEWNDAAAAGEQQRVYPWSSPPSANAIDCLHANYLGADSANGPDFCTAPGTGTVAAVGSLSPLGDGRWGQADLGGNVYEWALDTFAPYTATCPDCTNTEADDRVIRGGGYSNAAEDVLVSARNASAPAGRSKSIGVRCARVE